MRQGVASQVPGDTPPATDPDAGGPPRAALIAAAVLAVATIGVILILAATRDTTPRPVVIPAAPAPQAGSPACRTLLAALPDRLGDFAQAPIAQPAPESARAWRSGPDTEPVTVRCGLERPADFVVGSPIQVVDRVQWFRASQAAAADASTWYTVDRPVYVALTLPADAGPTPIQQLSGVIDRTLTAVPIDPGRPR